MPKWQPTATVRFSSNEQHGQAKRPLERIFINVKEDFVMSKDEGKVNPYYENSMKHWRAWGSWFSWGSPVGLGLFFMAIAFTIWLLGQTFHW